MRPALQTAFRDLDGTDRGNCVSAALASLLELDTSDVPHFVQAQEDGGAHWWDAMQEWLVGRGLWLVDVPRHVALYAAPASALMLAVGPSPRDPEGKTKHMVVWQGALFHEGRIVHDPHPEGTGLSGSAADLWGWYALARLDPAPARGPFPPCDDLELYPLAERRYVQLLRQATGYDFRRDDTDAQFRFAARVVVGLILVALP